MEQAGETIINTEFEFEGGTQHIRIDHLLDVLDDEEQYTGCYRVTLNKDKPVIVKLDNAGVWVDDKAGPTALSRIAGNLIENYSE